MGRKSQALHSPLLHSVPGQAAREVYGLDREVEVRHEVAVQTLEAPVLPQPIDSFSPACPLGMVWEKVCGVWDQI